MGQLPRPAVPVPLDVQILNETHARVHRPSQDRLSHRFADTAGYGLSASFRQSCRAKCPAILCLHQTINIGKEEPAGLGANVDLQYALQLAQRGYVTLAPDYPSFGEYPEKFDPRAGYVSGTMRAIYDNMRAIDLLQSLARRSTPNASAASAIPWAGTTRCSRPSSIRGSRRSSPTAASRGSTNTTAASWPVGRARAICR